MNRLVAILTVVGVLFTGLAAVIVQRDNFNAGANQAVTDGIDAIANASFLVLGFVGIFAVGIAVLLAAIAAMGGR